MVENLTKQQVDDVCTNLKLRWHFSNLAREGYDLDINKLDQAERRKLCELLDEMMVDDDGE